MRVQVISDTHGNHYQIEIDPTIDCLIHCGDSTNYWDIERNQVEFDNFFKWFNGLVIPHKVIIAGNHDTWALKQHNKERLKNAGIIYLENDYHEINGIKMFGSPYTPTFGNWYFMKERSKLDRIWEQVEPVDILITHGPPKGILDLSYRTHNEIERCGDESLKNRVFNTIKPKYHLFGHIHDNKDLINHGIRVIDGITFINASLVKDGKLERIHCNGYVFEI